MATDVITSTFTVIRVVLARLRFLAVFLVAALLVGYWDTIQNYLDKWTRPPVAPDTLAQVSDIEYYCVMHPTVIRAEPGSCPICGMPLAKRKKGEKVELPGGVAARVQLTPERIALAGVQTSAVSERDLVREIHAAATLDYDETRVAQLSARVPGRADELFVKSLGEHVKAGDPLYSLYSPEVYTAQREYLLARKRVRDLPENSPEDLRQDAIQVYNATMQKLVLWGATSGDLNRLDKQFDESGQVPTHFVVASPIAGIVVKKNIFEGGYVQTGDVPYTIADLSNLWLQVRIYEQDVPLVKLGERVEISVAGLAGKTFSGKITFLSFQLDPTTRTLAARVEVPNKDMELRPGLFAEVRIRVPVLPAQGDGSPPATAPNGLAANASAFRDALEPYFKAHQLLSEDKTQGVSEALHQMLEKLNALKAKDELVKRREHIAGHVHSTMELSKDLAKLRVVFRDISADMITLGRQLGVPADRQVVRVFRCPMDEKPEWLQLASETANPYQGSNMLTCGAQIETLPKVATSVPTRPQTSGSRLLSVPRSAVIIAGTRKVVFVASPTIEGVFDLKPVTLGPLATSLSADQAAGPMEYYPVLQGLDEGDRVVTVGAFLLDAENRLQGGSISLPPPGETPAASAPSQHQH